MTSQSTGFDNSSLKRRLDQEKLSAGDDRVRADGRKELVALTDGYRESIESWADLLRSCRRRGMTAPVLAVGYGALGFWKALREVCPSTREQRCWFHKQANVSSALPSWRNRVPAALREIYNAEDIDKARPRSRRSSSTMARSTRGRSRRSPTTPTCCWSSTSIRPNGCICARKIRPKALSPLSV